MNKIIIVILVVVIIVAGIWLLTRETDIIDEVFVFDAAGAQEVAEQWVKSEAPTYVFDGYNLELLEVEEIIPERRYELTFAFTSRVAGYGDRADEMAAQVITPHQMVVVTDQGEVVTAVTDGVYDEITGEMVEETLPETMQIDLYFVEVVNDLEQVVATERSIPYTVAPARAVLEALLAGPLPHEEVEGLSTSIPEGTELLSINIQDSVATADFSKELDDGVAGAAWVTAIRNQIEQTLLQFGTVDEVIIMVEGESEEILQP